MSGKVELCWLLEKSTSGHQDQPDGSFISYVVAEPQPDLRGKFQLAKIYDSTQVGYMV
jgi:hypothetical protein